MITFKNRPVQDEIQSKGIVGLTHPIKKPIVKPDYTQKYLADITNEKKLFLAKNYKVKGLVGHPLNSSTLSHYSSKEVVYSFNKVNNLYPLLTKTEYLLKSLFQSMYSLISKPIYLIRHDKVIIRLFVFLSPKVDKYLDTSTLVKEAKLRGASINILSQKGKGSSGPRKMAVQRIRKFLKFKSLRPNTIEILKSQIQFSPKALLNLTTVANKVANSIESGSKGFSLDLVKGVYNDKDCIKKGMFATYPYSSLTSVFEKNLEKLSVIFSKIFKKKVEFEIVKAQLPFQDSNILAQVIGYNANNYKFRRMLKILIPRAVIKNPSKELTPPSPYPMLASLNLNSKATVQNSPWKGWGAKDLNILFSQPSSYLPPFFFSKVFLNAVLLFNPAHLVSSKAHSVISGTEKGKTDVVTALVGQKSNKTTGKSEYNLINTVLGDNGLIDNINAKKQIFPSFLSGMNIKLAGRIMTESMRPRFTVQSHQEGSLARVKVHFTEKSRFTGKNKRGAFSFTVTISHVLN